MPDWMLATVNDFCRFMGLAARQLPVHIELDQKGELSLERHGQQLLVIYRRSLAMASRTEMVKQALALCHYRRQPSFSIQVGLYGEDQLALIARMSGEDIVVSHLERVVEQLFSIHEQLR